MGLRAATAPRLSPLIVPLLAELVLGIGVGVVCTVLAARISDSAGAALALAGQVTGTLMVLFRIVGAGVGVVVSQALGAGRADQADEAARATLGAATWIAGACAVAALLGAGPLLALLNAPPDVATLAAPLVRLLGPIMILDAWVATLSAVLRSHLHPRPVLRVVLLMHALHLGVALLAMRWLGLTGFALGLLASRLLAFGLLARLWRELLGRAPQLADYVQWRRGPLAPVLHIGLPGAAENIAWRVAFTVSIAAAGHLGTQALATHAYAMQVSHTLLLFGLATGLGCEIVVGHLVGAGQLHAARRLVARALALGLAISTGLALLAALAARPLLGLFTQDAAIIALGSRLLWWTVLLESGRTFNLVLVNALRATGDARYPVLAGAVSFVLVLGLGSWVLGVWMGLGLVGIWMAYAADEWLRGLLMWRRWATLGWRGEARRTRRRVRLQRDAPAATLGA